MYTLFLISGFFFCGYVLGQVHGWEKYEKIERESKIWSEV